MTISSSVATFGSAAIATPPTNDANAKRDDKPADESAAQQIIEASKPAGTGQIVDKTV
ncbi:MAG: hypothetical protein QOF14_4228 [Hyphomicrobiales bacterium]|jgi:hypothetical protein|nr:hypothetical protein [Hyphomicrobiales bacterium]